MPGIKIIQYTNLKYFVTKSFHLFIEVYENSTMPLTQIFEWHKLFNKGEICIKNVIEKSL